jgi:hypothetical protein
LAVLMSTGAVSCPGTVVCDGGTEATGGMANGLVAVVHPIAEGCFICFLADLFVFCVSDPTKA